jgi:DNA-binding protein HU-beta
VNKKELIEVMAEGAETNKATAEKLLNAFVDAVKGSLKSEEEVRIVGFGTFSVKHRAARTGRNPQTGEKIQIAASRSPKFTPGQDLKKTLKSVISRVGRNRGPRGLFVLFPVKALKIKWFLIDRRGGERIECPPQLEGYL